MNHGIDVERGLRLELERLRSSLEAVTAAAARWENAAELEAERANKAERALAELRLKLEELRR